MSSTRDLGEQFSGTESDAVQSGGSGSSTEEQLFQLRPLVEMEVIGACRRGRRRGRRNRTEAERQSGQEQRRRAKNERERKRVENVKNEYAKLQRLLGFQSGLLDEKSKEKRRYCKLRILTEAIRRIKELKEVLRADAELQERAATSAALPLTRPTPSSNLVVCIIDLVVKLR